MCEKSVQINNDVQSPNVDNIVKAVIETTNHVDKLVQGHKDFVTSELNARAKLWEEKREIQIRAEVEASVKKEVEKLTKERDEAQAKADQSVKDKVATRDKKIKELEDRVADLREQRDEYEQVAKDADRKYRARDLLDMLPAIRNSPYFAGWRKIADRDVLSAAESLLEEFYKALNNDKTTFGSSY